MTGVVRRWRRSARSGRSAASTQTRRASRCASASSPGSSRRLLVAFPTGTRRAAGRRAPAGHARGDGGPVRERAARAAWRSSASRTSRSARLDNPIALPAILSLHRVRRLSQPTCADSIRFPEHDWPDNIELLYYASTSWSGLGTMFIALMARRGAALLRGRLTATRVRCCGCWCSRFRFRSSRTPPAG